MTGGERVVLVPIVLERSGFAQPGPDINAPTKRAKTCQLNICNRRRPVEALLGCDRALAYRALCLYTRFWFPTDTYGLVLRGLAMATTKKDMVDRIAESTGTRQRLAKRVIQQFFDEIIAELAKGNRLEFRDFGVFETKTTPARTAQNPKTLEKVEVPAKRKAVFKPGRLMRQKLNTLENAGAPAQ